jgi:hypothetical protein
VLIIPIRINVQSGLGLGLSLGLNLLAKKFLKYKEDMKK